MEESAAASQVWRYLERLGCTRVFSTSAPYGQAMHCVQIWRAGQMIASGQHAQVELANSEALLEAMRFLGPPERTR